MAKLNKKELQLLNGFLEELMNKMSNAGCNDFTFPDDWSNKVKNSFSKKVYDHSKIPIDSEERDYVCSFDLPVLDYLYDKLNS